MKKKMLMDFSVAVFNFRERLCCVTCPFILRAESITDTDSNKFKMSGQEKAYCFKN